MYMYICPIPNGFRDRAISLHSYKIVDKKKILRTVFDTGINCSSDKIGAVYLVQYIFENFTVNSVHSATRVKTWRVAHQSAS